MEKYSKSSIICTFWVISYIYVKNCPNDFGSTLKNKK